MESEIIKKLNSVRQSVTGADYTKPLVERLKQISTKALEVASGRIVPNTVGRAVAGDTPKPDDTDIKKQEIMGQVDLNTRMGYHSDKLGNVTEPITGFNKEAGMKAPSINFNDPSQFERTMNELPGAMKDTVLAWADKIKSGSKISYTAPQQAAVVTSVAEAKEPDVSQFKPDVFTKGIAYNESRGASDPYKAVGPTKDLGKYQASPDTLKGWSKAWLGKSYTPEEFLSDPDAQEKFFGEFVKVAQRLNLTHEQAAVAWHRGWGELGRGDKKTRDTRFLERLNAMMDEDISQAYLQSFGQGLSSQ